MEKYFHVTQKINDKKNFCNEAISLVLPYL